MKKLSNYSGFLVDNTVICRIKGSFNYKHNSIETTIL